MPLFDYECPVCHKVLVDVLVKSSTQVVWCTSDCAPVEMVRLQSRPAKFFPETHSSMKNIRVETRGKLDA